MVQKELIKLVEIIKMMLMLTLHSFAFLLEINNLLHSSNIKTYYMPGFFFFFFFFLGMRCKIFRARYRFNFQIWSFS